MPKGKLRIFDFMVHGSAQYSLALTGHHYHLCNPDGKKPDWSKAHRPQPPNLILIDEKTALTKKFDVVIIRSPINIKRYYPHLRRGAIPIATMQTTSPYVLPDSVHHIIWNSYDVMKKYAKQNFPRKNHHYIIHGFSPEEFKFMPELEKKSRVLTVANAFRRRSDLMGYEMWHEISRKLNICDLVGGSNEDISKDIIEAKSIEELVKLHNSYKIFWNPTLDSACPRSRGEALMSGMACVSTDFFDIKNYFTHKKDILYANNAPETMENIKYLLENENFRSDLGKRARETAIKHFHIKDYIDKWNHIFSKL